MGLDLCETLPPLNEFVESLVGTHLQQDVHTFGILEKMFEIDDVGILERSVYFNFRSELRNDSDAYLFLCLRSTQ